MAPKKSETATKPEGAAASKSKSTSSHGSYQDMIKDAIITLKNRNGSSRQALKKYVRANNNLNVASDAMFDSLFNKALKAGVDKGVFEQPKGPSGGTKLAKTAKPAAAPKKAEVAKKDAPKKESEKKEPKEKKSAPAKKPAAAKKAAPKTAKKEAPKKAASTKKSTTAAPAPKKKAAPKKADAPAVVDKPAVLTKTKSGRVAKSTAPKAPATKKAAPKTKKATPKKAAASS